MNVLRDTAVLNLRKNNIAVLEQQRRLTQDRYNVGQTTLTDLAQAEASLAQARSALYASQAQLKTSIAAYRQIIGAEPSRLEPGRSTELLLPKSLGEAIRNALAEHPGVVSATHKIDAAELAVKVAESALSPALSVNAQASSQHGSFAGIPGSRQFSAAAVAQFNMPLYQGGAEYASIRQAKERLGQARLNADLQRDSVRASATNGGFFGFLSLHHGGAPAGRPLILDRELALEPLVGRSAPHGLGFIVKLRPLFWQVIEDTESATRGEPAE